ncbi:MAG: ATP-binding cassette domain-containing protein [Bacteroidota bacterium]
MNNNILKLKSAYIYQADNLILDDVSLILAKGEFAYLIGKTGSGKSSLLKTLYGALELKKGTAQVAGFDLGTLNRKNIPLLRRKIGIVFQDFNLLADRSVAANLMFVLKATGWRDAVEMQKRMKQVLADVGLVKAEQKMPHQLSGGEQQRVVIARALLNEPELIIADEPTGNLDPETSDDILLLLRKLSKQKNAAVLFATHDYRILQNFPARILRCHNGKVFGEEELYI